MVEAESSDPKFLGTLTHRLWTCPVLQPFREANCPKWLRDLVASDLNGDYTLPPDKVLLYTRALLKSVEPRLARKPANSTFNWIVRPDKDGVPYGRVYADGSRLFAEHRYFNLLARHGWAFVIIDLEGTIISAASGTVPFWIDSIYGSELWALLQAASTAFPGSPMHVDCDAVRIGVQNGMTWALSSARKLARAWVPLANILEGCTGSVTWLPAHCNKSAIGVRELSNGRKLDRVDLAMNDLVDTWAKREAKASPPSKSEINTVNDATRLVEGLAKWIGMCTHMANHFPAPDRCDRVKFIRDTTARRCSFARAGHALDRVAGKQVKRKAPSSVGVAYVVKAPKLAAACSSPGKPGSRAVEYKASGNPVRPKRPRLSAKQVEDKANFCFLEYWLARKELTAKPSPPPVSASDRKMALLARVAARAASSAESG